MKFAAVFCLCLAVVLQTVLGTDVQQCAKTLNNNCVGASGLAVSADIAAAVIVPSNVGGLTALLAADINILGVNVDAAVLLQLKTAVSNCAGTPTIPGATYVPSLTDVVNSLLKAIADLNSKNLTTCDTTPTNAASIGKSLGAVSNIIAKILTTFPSCPTQTKGALQNTDAIVKACQTTVTTPIEKATKDPKTGGLLNLIGDLLKKVLGAVATILADAVVALAKFGTPVPQPTVPDVGKTVAAAIDPNAAALVSKCTKPPTTLPVVPVLPVPITVNIPAIVTIGTGLDLTLPGIVDPTIATLLPALQTAVKNLAATATPTVPDLTNKLYALVNAATPIVAQLIKLISPAAVNTCTGSTGTAPPLLAIQANLNTLYTLLKNVVAALKVDPKAAASPANVNVQNLQTIIQTALTSLVQPLTTPTVIPTPPPAVVPPTVVVPPIVTPTPTIPPTPYDVVGCVPKLPAAAVPISKCRSVY